MIYEVVAKLIPERSREFLQRLTDGAIAGQRPDGSEIVASMARARIDADGLARWTETCFCSSPLAHERETVLDRYFSDLETVITDGHREFEGAPLMDRLCALAVDDG